MRVCVVLVMAAVGLAGCGGGHHPRVADRCGLANDLKNMQAAQAEFAREPDFDGKALIVNGFAAWIKTASSRDPDVSCPVLYRITSSSSDTFKITHAKSGHPSAVAGGTSW